MDMLKLLFWKIKNMRLCFTAEQIAISIILTTVIYKLITTQ